MALERSIFISSFMRSGSTHVAMAIQRLTWYEYTNLLGYANMGSDAHNVSACLMQSFIGRAPRIFHHHSRATDGTVNILKWAEIRNNVIQTRNVLDCLVSLREVLNIPTTKMPDVITPEGWLEMNEYDQYLWLAYNVVPWYFSFYVSWQQADIEKIFVRYEDFFSDQVYGMRRVADFLGLNPTDNDIEDAVKPKDRRFNQGVSGRGRKQIPEEIVDVIHTQAETWGLWTQNIKETLL